MIDPSVADFDPAADPVDWGFVRTVAKRFSGTESASGAVLAARFRHDMAEHTAFAEAAVAEFTGLGAIAAPATVRCVDRSEWVGANADSYMDLLRSLYLRYPKLIEAGVNGFTRKATAAEVGFMLGFVSRRVLGQYEVFSPAGDVMMYVIPNMVAVERQYGFEPQQFRLWVALHEVTHKVQFTGVPWLREYFFGLVDELMAFADPDPARLQRAAQKVVAGLRQRQDPIGPRGIVGLFADGAQIEALDRVQSLMTLLEGHANFVMDHLGAEFIPGQEQMSDALRTRRSDGGLAKVVRWVLGLEQKMAQYAVGERFCADIAALAGTRAIDQAWVAPENLPTLDDFSDPPAWLERVGVSV
ncbi:MAG: zinc-dependent metalloprotease [Actinobacteria bacterium]|nr:zinc-dependent metalloprotease [Actinomycetota bacterium]MCB9389764.1 zinc-dependent metalloprotease [Acidimicrobiia bacterium]